MKEHRITIEIDQAGRISADAAGFSGDACLREIERLLEGLAPGPATVTRKTDSGAARVSTTCHQSLEKKP